MLKPEFLSMILSASVSLLTLFTFFQSRMTSTEKRLTILEEKNKQNDKELEETKARVDNHDLQMQVLIQIPITIHVDHGLQAILQHKAIDPIRCTK